MDTKIISVAAKTSKIPLESTGKLLFDRISTFENTAVAFFEVKSGVTCTYGNLAINSLNLATNLRNSLGIVKNDHLAIISENSHKIWVAALAGLYLAAPFHLLNPGFTTYELKKYLMMSEPKVVFCSKQVLLKLQVVRDECTFIEAVVLFDDEDDTSKDVIPYKDLIQEGCDGKCFEMEEVDDLDNQVAYIANSSGTTGLPKGVMVTHANLRLNMSHVIDRELYPFEDNSVVLHVIPFYHVHGCGCATAGCTEVSSFW
ncbi:hypothetical protein Zmor_017052 [Zophobas morio]|uniref:AMP-dependent synthetase/ligase domain-containing protein n=1 Tax=Zophobas morio TaxID=2755281 RepID=A0AA38IBS4_9CUCU|nr:hypothetical protein Zmor_017052 [Zophobas morio]